MNAVALNRTSRVVVVDQRNYGGSKLTERLAETVNRSSAAKSYSICSDNL